MSDGMRARSASTGAEAVSAIILDWLDEYGPLLDALVTLRLWGDETAVAEVLAVPAVSRLRREWELWELFAGIDTAHADERLVPFLTSARLETIRFGLWGVAASSSGRV